MIGFVHPRWLRQFPETPAPALRRLKFSASERFSKRHPGDDRDGD
jgi:hypothetical protein